MSLDGLLNIEIGDLKKKIDSLLREANFQKAEEILEGEIENHPENAGVYALKGEVLEAKGKLKDALAQFEKAYELDPGESEYIYQQCEILLMLYRVDECIRLCRAGIELFPRQARFYMVCADAYLWSISVLKLEGQKRDGALDNVWKHLRNALSIEPENGEIHAVEGAAHLEEGSALRCMKSFEASLEYGLELYSDYIDLSLCLAILKLREGDPEQAGTHVKKGLKRFKSWKKAHFFKLMLFQEHLLMLDELYFNGDEVLPRMEAFYKEHKALMGKDVWIHFLSRDLREGILDFIRRRNSGDTDAAIEALENVLELFEGDLPLCTIFSNIKRPSLETILNIYLGDMYGKRGSEEDKKKAVACYKRALEITPRDIAAVERLGVR